ncbi:MAG: hypothetical protein Q9219_006882 [cf. Caloplaca sp. 3 TL-2023]
MRTRHNFIMPIFLFLTLLLSVIPHIFTATIPEIQPFPRDLHSNPKSENWTIEQNMDYALQILAEAPSAQLNQSSLRAIGLFKYAPPPDIPQRAESRSLSLAPGLPNFIIMGFDYRDPRHPPWMNDFTMENYSKGKWDQWRIYKSMARLQRFKGEDDRRVRKVSSTPIPWDVVKTHMPIEKADRLVKAAGYGGDILSIQMDASADEGKYWTFSITRTEGDIITNLGVRVDVMTGKVTKET